MDRHYLAFISYRHIKPDQVISGFLRKYLEGWHLPSSCPLPKKRRVFRDTDELPTSTDLGHDIENALENSSCLIALCSEEYVGSKWCMREIDRYIEMGRKDRIIPILVSGTIETSVPPQLKGITPVLDLRGQSARRKRKSVYEGIPRLLEILSGTQAEELAASERRFRMFARSSAFAGTAAIILGLILYTTHTADRIQKNNQAITKATTKALEAEQEALAQRDEAFVKNASLLARKARIAIEEDDDVTAIQLSLEALPDDDSSELPLPKEVVSVLQSALIMPDKQRNTYHLSETFDRGTKDPVTKASSTNSYLEEALSMGYTHVLRSSMAYYGGGKQMLLISPFNNKGCTLNGEPFNAEKVWDCPDTFYFAGWDGMNIAIYQYQVTGYGEHDADASWGIPCKEEPLDVVFSPDALVLAVLEKNGRLTLYSADNGRVVISPEGTFLDFKYSDKDYQLLTLSTDGTVQMIDSITGKVLAEMDAPSPVRKMDLCTDNSQVLALCDDCAVIFHAGNGELLYRLTLTEEAQYVSWVIPKTGDEFTVTYEDRIDIYKMDTAQDLDTSVMTHLTCPSCCYAGYSTDGKYVYLESGGGNISKWDAHTGEQLWINHSEWESQAHRFVPCLLTTDGTALWRQNFSNSGVNIDRIDAKTGELLYTTDWNAEKVDGSRILESPDGRMGLVIGMFYDRPVVLFDTGSGELKWTKDFSGYAVFSEDGSQILSLNAETVSVDLGTFLEIIKNNGYYQWEDFNGVMHEEEYTGDLMELVYRRISAETGEVLEEQVLTKMGCASKGELTSIDGGFRVLAENQWEVNLQTGEIFQCDPETIAATSEQNVSIPCAFAGQNAFVETADGITRLVSNPEGTLILDAGERSLEVSPDGESMVLYAENFTPILIWATDASVLIQEAEKRLSSLEAQ